MAPVREYKIVSRDKVERVISYENILRAFITQLQQAFPEVYNDVNERAWGNRYIIVIETARDYPNEFEDVYSTVTQKSEDRTQGG